VIHIFDVLLFTAENSPAEQNEIASLFCEVIVTATVTVTVTAL